jgi:hypothetical protein
MKTILFSLAFSLSFVACDMTNQQYTTLDEVAKQEYKHLRQQAYSCKSERAYDNTLVSHSFEFIKNIKEEHNVKILLNINSLRSAEPLKRQMIVKLNEEVIVLPYLSVRSNNDAQNVSSTTSTPRYQSVTIDIPESTQEITKADGTKETVKIPASTRSESVLVNDQVSHNEVQFLRNEQAMIQLNSDVINKIKNANSLSFKIYYENHGIWLKPSEAQLYSLKSFL